MRPQEEAPIVLSIRRRGSRPARRHRRHASRDRAGRGLRRLDREPDVIGVLRSQRLDARRDRGARENTRRIPSGGTPHSTSCTPSVRHSGRFFNTTIRGALRSDRRRRPLRRVTMNSPILRTMGRGAKRSPMILSPSPKPAGHLIPRPDARFIAGHSLGAWDPHIFGGAWSIAPDPRDFHDFTGVDLIATPPVNFFRDDRRPTVHASASTVRYVDTRARCPRRRPTDRRPTRFVRCRVQPARCGWKTAIDIFVASEDTFHLEPSVARFANAAHALGSDARISIIRGADYWSIFHAQGSLIVREASESYERSRALIRRASIQARNFASAP
jgi:hypothetical protein